MKKVFEIFKWSMLLSVIVLLMAFSIKNQKPLKEDFDWKNQFELD